MKFLFSSVAFACALAGSAEAALALPTHVNALPSDDCTSVALAEQEETVQVGAVSIGNVTLNGPASCVASVTSDSPSARVTLEKKNDLAFVRIIAVHEGYANVDVIGTNARRIGSIKVAVYPRDRRGSL